MGIKKPPRREALETVWQDELPGKAGGGGGLLAGCRLPPPLDLGLPKWEGEGGEFGRRDPEKFAVSHLGIMSRQFRGGDFAGVAVCPQPSAEGGQVLGKFHFSKNPKVGCHGFWGRRVEHV